MSTSITPWRRWRDTWHDRRLTRLPDRAFCRSVTLEGWEHVAAAAEERRGLLIAVDGNGLPRTAIRALRLFAAARPLAGVAAEELAAALTSGAVFFAPAEAPCWQAPLPPAEQLTAEGQTTAAGARVSLR